MSSKDISQSLVAPLLSPILKPLQLEQLQVPRQAPPPPCPISKNYLENYSENYSENNTSNEKRIHQLSSIHSEAMELFKKKNHDYGDAFANYGPIGVLVRLGDKICRLQSITRSKISLINTESLRDTLIDLHNYSAMAIMLIDEKKEISYEKK